MKPWRLGQDSYSKLVIWFRDGNVRTFYSMDWRSPSSRSRSRETGLHRLHKLIQKHRQHIKAAIIYDLASGQELQRYPTQG